MVAPMPPYIIHHIPIPYPPPHWHTPSSSQAKPGSLSSSNTETSSDPYCSMKVSHLGSSPRKSFAQTSSSAAMICSSVGSLGRASPAVVTTLLQMSHSASRRVRDAVAFGLNGDQMWLCDMGIYLGQWPRRWRLG